MIKKITHLTLLVKDQDEALKFYNEKFGFQIHTDMKCPDTGMRWLTICPEDQPGMEVALMPAMTNADLELVGKQAGSYSIGCLMVDDCHKTFNELQSRGVEFIGKPNTEQWGTGVVMKDLYGNSWYINEESK